MAQNIGTTGDYLRSFWFLIEGKKSENSDGRFSLNSGPIAIFSGWFHVHEHDLHSECKREKSKWKPITNILGPCNAMQSIKWGKLLGKSDFDVFFCNSYETKCLVAIVFPSTTHSAALFVECPLNSHGNCRVLCVDDNGWRPCNFKHRASGKGIFNLKPFHFRKVNAIGFKMLWFCNTSHGH